MRKKSWVRVYAAATALAATLWSAYLWAAGPYVLVTGRRDPQVIVIDLAKALVPANNGTDRAIVSHARVTRDVEDQGQSVPAAGLPSNIVIPPEGRVALVVNHGGNATPTAVAGFQHGHMGQVAVLDLRAALDPANNGTTNALTALIPTGHFGPVGLAVTPDRRFALVSNSEGNDREDGARHLSVIDLRLGSVTQTVELALNLSGGKQPQSPGKSCAELAANPSLAPRGLPHPDFGCFPDSNGVGISARHGGFAFVANGGTDDVSVIDVQAALAGTPGAEIARIPVERGPWGLAVSPRGGLVAVTNRESAEVPAEGSTISLLDVDRAIDGGRDTEVARVQVGTDDSTRPSRPFGLAFTPEGRELVVANFRTNTVSIVDVRRALAKGLDGGNAAERARITLITPAGTNGDPRPRGVGVTPDGRYAVVSGGAVNASGGGVLWVIDLAAARVVATVIGVGNEPYMLAITRGPRDHSHR